MRSGGHLRAGERAGEVGADVQHLGGTLLEGEQRVEARDPVRVGGRHVEPLRRVAERALADPADAALRGPQRGQEQVAPVAVAAGDPPVAGLGYADDRVDRRPLGLRRLGERQAQIH